MTEEERILAGEHALGLLSGGERAAFERRLSEDAALRAERVRWDERLARLAEDVAEVRPPQRVRRHLQRRLFGEAPKVRRDWSPWFWAGGGLAAAAAFSLFIIGAIPEDRPGHPGRVAAEDDSLVLVALYRESVGVLHLRRDVGAARPGRALELWVIGGDGVPVSLGVLPEAPDTAIVIPPELAEAVMEGVLAVTEERPGGSPSGAPTSPPIATGGIIDGEI